MRAKEGHLTGNLTKKMISDIETSIAKNDTALARESVHNWVKGYNPPSQ